jgi:hypothetical protein
MRLLLLVVFLTTTNPAPIVDEDAFFSDALDALQREGAQTMPPGVAGESAVSQFSCWRPGLSRNIGIIEPSCDDVFSSERKQRPETESGR